jgi:hypothetical protein
MELDKKCESCLFYGLCVAAKLPHCNGECYVKDKFNCLSNRHNSTLKGG